MINLDKIIWTGKSTGVVLEEYQGKYTIKATRKWTQDNQEKAGYDWVYREVYNKDSKKKEMGEKPSPCGVFLGDHAQAIASLRGWLNGLGGSSAPPSQKQAEEESDIPF